MSSAFVAPHHRAAAATLPRIFAADFLQMQQTPFQSPSPRPSPRKRGEGEQRRTPNIVGKRYCRRFSCVPSPRHQRGEGSQAARPDG